MHALEIKTAIKNYSRVEALKGVSLNVREGEFFGLLGPNGAGKTTLIQSVVGLCRLTSGHIQVFGHDVVKDYMKSRELIGYSPQEVNLERFFSIRKTLEFQAGFFGARAKEQKQIVNKLLEQFNLTDKAGVQFYKLSGGMQKRALIAKALVSQPKLLILDEPTAGVDVEQRHELWQYLRLLNKNGTTIILTTHYIDEAEALCERIGIINLGQIKELGSPKSLIEKYCEPKIIITTNEPVPSACLAEIRDVKIQTKGNQIFAHGDRAGIMTEKILKNILRVNGISVQDIAVSRGTLEDVFVKVTGAGLCTCEEKDPASHHSKNDRGQYSGANH